MIGTKETCPACEGETVTSENVVKLCTYHYSEVDDDEQG